jgi:hypothetical protein
MLLIEHLSGAYGVRYATVLRYATHQALRPRQPLGQRTFIGDVLTVRG